MLGAFLIFLGKRKDKVNKQTAKAISKSQSNQIKIIQLLEEIRDLIKNN
jgi:large-conductance mechanosensitive channel